MKKKLHIVFIYLKRYSFYPIDYLGRGLGGTESTLVLLARALAKLGHKIEVYNCCFKNGVYDNVIWKSIWELNTEKQADIVVSLRLLETFKKYKFNAKIRAVWIHDESLPRAEELDNLDIVNMWIAISETQKKIIQKSEVIKEKNWFLTRNAFDEDIYNSKTIKKIKKIKNRAIYCSSPDRGLAYLLRMWKEIKKHVQDASLVVTGSYELWGLSNEENKRMTINLHKIVKSLNLKDVTFMNNVPKLQLAQLQAESEVLLYPTNFNEMFCISALECLSVGTPIITSHKGALTERIQDRKNGFLIKEAYGSTRYEQKFILNTISFLNNPEAKKRFSLNAVKSVERMHFDELAKEWITEFKMRLK